jgi:hypothetical protein
MPPRFRGTANTILRQVEELGYAVSFHDMRWNVDLHSVRLSCDGIPRAPGA